MVSLNKSLQKAMSFSHSNANDEEDEPDAVVGIGDLGDEEGLIDTATSNILEDKLNFKSVDTLLIGGLMILCSVGMFVVSTVVPIECAKVECFVHPLSLLLYLHSLFWGIFLICDQYINYQHIKVRRRGYLEFYNDTRNLSQLPFWIVSTWSTLLLTISTVLHDHCISDTTCGNTIQLNKAEYITICIGVELALLLAVLMSYMYQIWKFNMSKAPPDVLREDLMSSATDMGPKSLGRVDEEIFERQADMIRYYKDHNVMLRRKVLELNYQISGRTPVLS